MLHRRGQRGFPYRQPHDSEERHTGLGKDMAEDSARIVSPWDVEVTHTGGSKKPLRKVCFNHFGTC